MEVDSFTNVADLWDREPLSLGDYYQAIHKELRTMILHYLVRSEHATRAKQLHPLKCREQSFERRRAVHGLHQKC